MPKFFPLVPKGFSPFLEFVGVTYTAIENGYSKAVLQITDKLLNSQRIVHGGATFTLADCGMGAAIYSCLEGNERVRTIETKIVYINAVKSGTLTCDTHVVHRSKSIATLESEIKQRGKLVAKAIGTFSIYKGKSD